MTLVCRFTAGLVFLVALLGKVRSRRAFREFAGSVREMTTLAPPWDAAASAGVVLAEASIVALLTAGQTAPVGFTLAGAVLLGFSGAIARAVRAGSHTACRCFGAASAPLSGRHLLRNAGLLAIATAGLSSELLRPAGGTSLAGDAIALPCAGVVALLIIYFDDLADLLTAPPRNY
jgi:hypothetical protein